MPEGYEGRQGPAANPAVASRKRQRKVNDENINGLVLRTLLSQENGRRWLWLRLSECNVFSQTVVFGPGGHAASAFNEGKRMLGLKLLSDIQRYDPMAYMKMTQENTRVEFDLENSDAGPDALDTDSTSSGNESG